VSATLVAKSLAAGHGARALFADLDLVVAPGDVVGLVGVNGAGKSTLLKMLAGLSAPEAGTVSLAPPGALVGYLAQETERIVAETVEGFLARRTGVAAAQIEMDEAAEAFAASAPGADDRYSVALEQWLALGGADLEDRIEAVLADVGPGIAPSAEMVSLSGGQGARVGLAALLLARFDVFLLDEPTNDLDLPGLQRLESFVQGLRAGVVVVSHDREFLARTVTSVLALDLAQQQVSIYNGGYQAYLDEREVARRHAREEFEEYADRRAGLGERAQMQRAWMDNGIRNARRKAPDNDKIGRNARRETTEKQAAKARQTQRMIERLDVVVEPRKEWELRMEIAAAPRAGAVVATLTGVLLHRPGFTLGPISTQLDWADRVVITGPNGSGKTTLLDVLLGRVVPDEGRAVLGSGVVVGEVDQVRRLFAGQLNLIEVFSRELPEHASADVRTLLAKFGLRADHVTRPSASLSPGERTRAGLALLQERGVNLLVLDEPTNHLDLAAIEQLESALANYEGTLVLVTHDRRMLETVTTNRSWRMDAGQLSEG
jgi:ATPase subunit of ABC transporter with duplicated ATPase domains